MSGFRTILVPVDFSSHGQAALAMGVGLARAHEGARLHVAHVFELRVPLSPPYERIAPATYLEQVRAAASERFAKTLQGLAGSGVETESHLLDGVAADTICGLAASLPADVIVMGTRGLTGLKHVLLGSVAARVVREAACPVMTLKADDEHGAGAETSARFQRILVPVDFSPGSDAALALALRIAPAGCELHLLHATDVLAMVTPAYGLAVPPGLLDDARAAATGRLAPAAERVRNAGHPVTTHVSIGPAAESILDTTRRVAADLIVMGTHGRTGLRRFVLGSVAARTVQHAQCPVLTTKTG
jgi:nucleotide-binding universal stress UspA family protein